MANDGAASPVFEVARAFRPRILAERERTEAGRRLPVDLTRELAEAGFSRIFLPAAYGGLDLTPMEGMEVYEELARADASVAWCVWNGNVNWTTAQLSKAVAQAIFADPGMIVQLFSFPSLAEYERYRTAIRQDETALAAWRFQEETRCVVSFERSFMRPILEDEEI